jgi:type IV secretory pathway component VirB8
LDDQREMQSRWYGGGLINYLSSPQVFDEFFRQNVEQTINKFSQSHTIRTVEIVSLEQEGGTKSRSWKVKFNTYDLSPGKEGEASGGMILVTKHWTASLQAVFVPERMFLARRLINPLGFTVIHYSQSEES